MSMINRYKFTKSIYSGYLVFIYRLGNYYSFSYDKEILKYIKFKGNTNIIKRKTAFSKKCRILIVLEKYFQKLTFE